MNALSPRSLISRRSGPLAGSARVPGDKSISHRSLILSACAVGRSRIAGLLEADDVLRTASALRALGIDIDRSDGTWIVTGRGVGGLIEAETVLDLGNSGTGVRLLMGLLATHPMTSVFTGDDSLRARPMGRVIAPLEKFGAQFKARAGGTLPVTLTGTASPVPVQYELPVASAQVKSAILLAGLNAPGKTTVIEPQPTRDHTEHMLRHFGADVVIEPRADGGRSITLTGRPELTASDITVPADISSAAFPLVAALLVPGSDITLRNIGLNPLRTGLLDTLIEMGAEIAIENRREAAGEPAGDLHVTAGPLRGVTVPASRVPSMIDEFPILAVAASLAEGTTVMTGLAELRVKESDRLSVMAEGLTACGVRLEEGADSLTIEGTGTAPKGGAEIATHLDHRIAMAFLVLGLVSAEPVGIDDAGPIGTSFPEFAGLMTGLGARLEDRP
ncbi:MAG: 3-phosphoshikimate 1-carboxyvinyltransferase [Rhodospirillales bacterium]